jgi:hypothetical protein
VPAGFASKPTFDKAVEHQKMPKDYRGANRDERVSAAKVSMRISGQTSHLVSLQGFRKRDGWDSVDGLIASCLEFSLVHKAQAHVGRMALRRVKL